MAGRVARCVPRLIYPRKMVSPRQLPKPIILEICDSLLRVYPSHRGCSMIHTDSYRARFQAVSNFDRVLEKGRKEGRKGRWRRSGFFCWPSNFEGTVLSLFNARFLELGPRDNATWYSRGRSKSGARAGIPVERAKHRSLLPSVSLHEPCV